MVFNILTNICNHHHSHIYKIFTRFIEEWNSRVPHSILLKSISTSIIKCNNVDESQKHHAK